MQKANELSTNVLLAFEKLAQNKNRKMHSISIETPKISVKKHLFDQEVAQIGEK